MKTIKYICALATLTVLFNACSASWLDQQPQGGTYTEEQFSNLDDKLHGSIYGAYALMYAYSDHDQFGFRSIDMYGDINCGDMAMKTNNYGWFMTDEQGFTYQRRLYYWNYYYGIIRQCNKAILYAKNDIDLSFTKGFSTSSLLAEDLLIEDQRLQDSLTAHNSYIKDNFSVFNYYGQLLALRGWCYANLLKYFCPTPDDSNDWGKEWAVPVYTEEDVAADTTMGNPRLCANDVYAFVVKDLTTAVRILSITEKDGYARAIKQEINSDIALLTLAYCHLNCVKKSAEENVLAYIYAEEFIDKKSAPILSNEKVLTTGFAEINEDNWIWGQDVNLVTSTALGSFFGQVDIYTYSYAWAGDVKGIDANLLTEITKNHPWDIRAKWWNNVSNYKYAPDSKFFSPSAKALCQKSIKAENVDRVWLCDQVFMRAELGYLIAAEARCRYGDYPKAIEHLTAITSQRILEGKTAAYETWKNSLSDKTLDAEIYYNWRVEMWGEGYGMQTFRRHGESVTLGANHKTRAKSTIKPNDGIKFTFEIPSSEQYYNPAIRQQTNLEVK